MLNCIMVTDCPSYVNKNTFIVNLFDNSIIFFRTVLCAYLLYAPADIKCRHRNQIPTADVENDCNY